MSKYSVNLVQKSLKSHISQPIFAFYLRTETTAWKKVLLNEKKDVLIVKFLKCCLADCGTHIHNLISETDVSLPSTKHTYEHFVFFRFLEN